MYLPKGLASPNVVAVQQINHQFPSLLSQLQEPLMPVIRFSRLPSLKTGRVGHIPFNQRRVLQRHDAGLPCCQTWSYRRLPGAQYAIARAPWVARLRSSPPFPPFFSRTLASNKPKPRLRAVSVCFLHRSHVDEERTRQKLENFTPQLK